MIIIRPIKRHDQEIFGDFSFEGLLGMTNLPRDRDKFFDKIIHSENSFSKKIEKPGKEEYSFVLEELTTGRIGGTCGILAESSQSFGYSYRIETLPFKGSHPSSPKEIKLLRLVPNASQASEVCALFLHPTFRHSGLGRLLSLSRFLFIAGHLYRFEKKIVAELRGYIDQRQNSPFWEGIGRHFCNLSFVELMAQIEMNHRFSPEIFPQFPIYIPLLPKETEESIGKIHDNTKAAHHMLLQEGFIFDDRVDVFEGGPILSATTSNIRAIKESRLIQVELTADSLPDEKEYIISNERLDFRACFGKMQIISPQWAMINEEVAYAMMVKHGDFIRYVTAR